ncbi:MAG: decaprenyl-phosphate phosphoribosyltransferase [Acidobacteriota bacterium]|nr:decaprenyl-phosphate phosphoribosyltransferase [Acidobacteriota bacterium]
MTRNAPTPRGPFRALISAMRVPQWVKNGLIVIAPAAAGILFRADVLRHTAVAFVSFCLISSAGYLVNDLRDAPADREHPTKRYRAIASGQLSPRRARVAAVVLLIVGFVLPFFLWHPWGLLLILGLYVVITLAYIFGLKNVAVVEFAALASGFFLRAYAGATASHVFVSTWFLMVISFGALFLVVGKRSSELKKIGVGSTRRVLAEYSPEFLTSALTLSATAVVTGYCLWAFDTSATGLSSIHHHVIPIRLSVIPVVLATLFIMRAAEAGDGAAPEELVLRNRTVQLLAASWAVLLFIGVYA